MIPRVPRTIILMAIVTASLLLQACGGVMRARYYQPDIDLDGSVQDQWGDGLAVAVPTHCMWLDVGPLSDDIMWVGPLFLPVFPIGAAAERIEGPMEQGSSVFVELLLVPASDTEGSAFALNPEAITMEFDNGESLPPDYLTYASTTREWELHSEMEWSAPPGEPPAQMGPYYEADWARRFEIDGWARIGMRFTRPDDEVHSTALRIHDLRLPDGSIADYEFTLRFVEKRRYVYSGKHQNNEPLWQTEAGACLELMDEA